MKKKYKKRKEPGMKILITTDWYKPVINGVVTSILNIEQALRKQGHEVRILTLSRTTKSYQKGNVTYLGSMTAGKIYPDARIRLICNRKWVRDIMRWEPDIVHSQCEFTTFGLAKKISREMEIPLVHTYHTIYEDYTHYFSPNRKMGKRAAAMFSKVICNQADRIIVPTEKIRGLLKGYRVSTGTSVIPSGIDMQPLQQRVDKMVLRKELGLPEKQRILLYLGRLAREKNLEEVFKYMGQYRGEKITMLVVGDGPDREAAKEAAECVSEDVQVIFTGMVRPKDIWRYYGASDIFVSASQSETQGLTYVEAAAAGLPLLCRRDDCLKNVLAEGRNGWQFETEEGFIQSLSAYMNCSAKELEKMSGESRRITECYSILHTAGRLEEAYRNAVSQKQEKSYVRGMVRAC